MKQKVVFIGNSIVNGFPFSRGKSFPGLIRDAIKSGKPTFASDIINKGENGQTTADITARFDHDVIEHQPAAVFIMTGTNDFIFNEASPEQAFRNLENMAACAEDAGIVPVYMTPIYVDADLASRMWMTGLGIDYDRVNRQIQEFSDFIRNSGKLFVDTNIVYQRYASGDALAAPGDETDGLTDDVIAAADDAIAAPGGTIAPAGDGTDDLTGDGTDGLTDDAMAAAGDALAASDDAIAASGDETDGLTGDEMDGLAAYGDGVHPTREGYAYLAEAVLQWIETNREALRI